MKLPTNKDIEWIKTAMSSRHQGGFDRWWENIINAGTGEDVIRLIVTVWEAGRVTEEDSNETKTQQ